MPWFLQREMWFMCFNTFGVWVMFAVLWEVGFRFRLLPVTESNANYYPFLRFFKRREVFQKYCLLCFPTKFQSLPIPQNPLHRNTLKCLQFYSFRCGKTMVTYKAELSWGQVRHILVRGQRVHSGDKHWLLTNLAEGFDFYWEH